MSHEGNESMRELFDAEDVRDVLRDSFYAPSAEKAPKKKARKKKPKPDHYEVICISMYKEDLARVDAMVSELKTSGHRKMSRSGLIRFALDQVDVSKLPRSY